MIHTLPLNEDQRDCLQELTNVAIGAAAESLAGFTQEFITLPIPQICFSDTDSLLQVFEQINLSEPTTVVRQACRLGEFDCQALLFIDDSSVDSLSSSMVDLKTAAEESDLIKRLYTTISDTCFESLSDVMEESISQQSIEFPVNHEALESVDMQALLNADKSICVEIDYQAEAKPFKCHLLLVFPEQAIAPLKTSLDRLLH